MTDRSLILILGSTRSERSIVSMSTILNITETGAKADSSLQTMAIQAAIDLCHQNGGGEVLIPAGQFLTGALLLRSNVTLHLMAGARLLGSPNYEEYRMDTVDYTDPICPLARRPAEYRHSRWHNAMICAFDCDNIGIVGQGALLDGADCYDAKGEEGFRGPHLSFFSGCSNIRLEGYTISRSANYAHLLEDCANVFIKDVTILGGHDGIHLQRCKHVMISDCTLHTGDDCIAGADNLDITVQRCDLNTSCNGFRIGAYDLLVQECRLYGPGRYEHKVSKRHNMLSAFSYFSPVDRLTQMVADNWVIRDCMMDSIDYLFVYDFSGRHIWQNSQPLYHVRMESIKATNLRYPMKMYADRAEVFSLEVVGARISFAAGCESQPILSIHHCNHVLLKDVIVENNTSLSLVEASNPDRIQLVDVDSHSGSTLVQQIDAQEWNLPGF